MKFLIVFVCLLHGSLQQQNLYRQTIIQRNENNANKNNIEDIRYSYLNGVQPEYKDLHNNVEINNKQIYNQVSEEEEETSETENENQYAINTPEEKDDNEDDNNNKNYIKKMAEQLLLARQRVPILSDYQRNILKQDPLVQKYVFGPKEQSTTRPTVKRSRSKQKETIKNSEISSQNSNPSSKSSSATSRSGNGGGRRDASPSRRANIQEQKYGIQMNGDNSNQGSELQYVTVPPPGLPTQQLTSKVQLIPNSQPYVIYNLEESQKQPQVHAIPILTPVNYNINLQPTVTPVYHHEHEHKLEDDDGHHHVSNKLLLLL